MATNMTQGNPLTIILKFTIPLLLGNLFQQLYNMADTIIVGKYVGEDALAAVGSTGTIMFLVLGICNGMVSGFSVLTSQRYGAEDEIGTRKSIFNGILLSIVIVCIMTICSLLGMKSLLRLMNTPENIFQDAYRYISIICMGIATSFFYNYASSTLRAIGNSRIPLYALIFSASLNVVLDLILIIFFRLGVAGAAIATVISQGISAVLCICYIVKKLPFLTPRREERKPDLCYLKEMTRLGVPMSLMFGITASGTMIMQSAINMFGSLAVAGFTAAGKIQGFLTQGMFTIGQTMSSYIGQNYGKRDLARIQAGVRAAIKVFVFYSIAAAFLVLISLPYILQLFFSADVDMGQIMPWARIYITESMLCYLPLSLIFIFRNTIQACGFSFSAMFVGIAELLARILMAAISMKIGSYRLAVAADPFAWLIGGITGAFLYSLAIRKIRERMG